MSETIVHTPELDRLRSKLEDIARNFKGGIYRWRWDATGMNLTIIDATDNPVVTLTLRVEQQ